MIIIGRECVYIYTQSLYLIKVQLRARCLINLVRSRESAPASCMSYLCDTRFLIVFAFN